MGFSVGFGLGFGVGFGFGFGLGFGFGFGFGLGFGFGFRVGFGFGFGLGVGFGCHSRLGFRDSFSFWCSRRRRFSHFLRRLRSRFFFSGWRSFLFGFWCSFFFGRCRFLLFGNRQIRLRRKCQQINIDRLQLLLNPGNIGGHTAFINQIDIGFNQSNGFRMAHDQHIGARHQISNGSHRFHQNSALFRIAESGCVGNFQFGLFAFPNFVAKVVDQGQLQFVISLGQGRHADTFHHRIGILQTVSQTASGGIDDDFIGGNTEVLQQDIALFSQVNVDGRRSNDCMSETHRCRADSFVVFVFHRTQNQVFTLTLFGNFLEHLFIFFHIGRAPYDQWYINGCQNLFYSGDRFICAGVFTVGIGAF